MTSGHESDGVCSWQNFVEFEVALSTSSDADILSANAESIHDFVQDNLLNTAVALPAVRYQALYIAGLLQLNALEESIGSESFMHPTLIERGDAYFRDQLPPLLQPSLSELLSAFSGTSFNETELREAVIAAEAILRPAVGEAVLVNLLEEDGGVEVSMTQKVVEASTIWPERVLTAKKNALAVAQEMEICGAHQGKLSICNQQGEFLGEVEIAQ